MKIAVLIPYVNEQIQTLYTVLGHLRELQDFEHKIILVDNGSAEAILGFMHRVVEGLRVCHDVTLLEETVKGTVPPWQKAASNAGDCDVLVFSDAHILLSKDFYQQQVPLLSKEHPVVYAAGGFWNWCQRIFHYQVSPDCLRPAFKGTVLSTEPYEVSASQMGCVLVSREFFEKIGRFGSSCFEEYGGYSAEEIALSLKTWMFGARPLLNPNAFFIHANFVLTQPLGRKTERSESMAILNYVLGGLLQLDRALPSWLPNCSEGLKERLIQISQEDRQFVENHTTLALDEVFRLWEVLGINR